MTQAELVAAFINGLFQVLLCNTNKLRDPETGKPLTYELVAEKAIGLFQPHYTQEKIDWTVNLGREIAINDQFWEELPDLLVNTPDDEGQRVALIQTNQNMKAQGLRPLDLTKTFNQMRNPKEEWRLKLRQALASLDNPS